MMNLQELFNVQAKLDKRIVEEHGLQGQDLLDKKILALQVELGECANEYRAWKFWSKDQEPRTYKEIECPYCDEGKVLEGLDAATCDECHGQYELGIRNPLLEEYVDAFHFILSIGLEINMPVYYYYDPFIYWRNDIVYQFISLFKSINDFHVTKLQDADYFSKYIAVVNLLLGLGDQLGFAKKQIYDAYMDKNQTNHTRQDTGY